MRITLLQASKVVINPESSLFLPGFLTSKLEMKRGVPCFSLIYHYSLKKILKQKPEILTRQYTTAPPKTKNKNKNKKNLCPNQQKLQQGIFQEPLIFLFRTVFDISRGNRPLFGIGSLYSTLFLNRVVCHMQLFSSQFFVVQAGLNSQCAVRISREQGRSYAEGWGPIYTIILMFLKFSL